MNDQGNEYDKRVINWVFEYASIIVQDPLPVDGKNAQGKKIELPPIIILDNYDKNTSGRENKALGGLAVSEPTVVNLEENNVMEQESVQATASPYVVVANLELNSAASLTANKGSSNMVTIEDNETVLKQKSIDSGSTQETDGKTGVNQPGVGESEINLFVNLSDTSDTLLVNNEMDAPINSPDIIDLIDDDSDDALEKESQAGTDFHHMNGGIQSAVRRIEPDDEIEEDVDDPGTPSALSLRIGDVCSTSYGGIQNAVRRTEPDDENEEDVDDPGTPPPLSLRIGDVRSTSYGGIQSTVCRTEPDNENKDVDDHGIPPVLSLRIEDVRSTSYQEFNLEDSADSGTLNHVASGVSEGSTRPTDSIACFSESSAVISRNNPSPDIIEITSDDDDDDDDLNRSTVVENRQQSDGIIECRNTEVRPRVRLKSPENLLITPDVDDSTTSLLLPGTLICDLCKTQFDSKDDLFNHYSTNCIEGVIDKDFKCNKCDRVFKGPYNLKLHICLTNSIKISDDGTNVKRRKKTTKFINQRLDKGFHCDTCNLEFKEFNEFGHHILMHKKKFFCSVCNKGFTKKDYFLAHLRAHYGYLYECTYCRRGFALQSDLARHIRIHTKEKPFTCSYESCLRKFSTLSSLNIHLRVHTGERPYKCAECHKTYTQIGYFKKHKCVKPIESSPWQPQYTMPGTKLKRLANLNILPPMPIVMSIPYSITNPYTENNCTTGAGINIGTSNQTPDSCHEPPRIASKIMVNKAIVGNF